MKKKRREFLPPLILGLDSAGGSWVKSLSGGQTRAAGTDGLYRRFGICPVFGQGEILHLQWEDMEMIITRLELRQDIVLQHSSEEDFWQLSFLLEGQKVISSDSESEIIQEKGEAYLANIIGFRGRIRLCSEQPFREIKIRISPSALKKQGFPQEIVEQRLNRQQQVRPITRELFGILVDLERRDLSTPVQRIYLRAKILELLALQLEGYNREVAVSTEGYGSINLRRLYKVRKLITENLDKNFSLADLSREASIQASLLNEEFNQAFGQSVREFSIKVKMEHARQLLENTDLLIYEISEVVGYKNATHFSAAFKRFSGKTPKQFRELQ